MIYISAQTDDTYFIWQLELQILNFQNLGIEPDKHHILVCYNEKNGINYAFQEFVAQYKTKARFFFYPDQRISRQYQSCIRPHILAQHYKKYRYLEWETIFYHDSDILFTDKLPDFERLCSDKVWYFSDTRDYIDSQFLISRNKKVFLKMCKLLDINPKLVVKNDKNAGGAQSIIKNVNFSFWEKIEQDCEALFILLEKQKAASIEPNEIKGVNQEKACIPSWTADMWVLLWNGFKIAEVKIDEELNFCWPHYPIEFWDLHKIFHNAGVESHQRSQLFFKSDYLTRVPYFESFDSLEKDRCSNKYVEKIKEVKDRTRYNLTDTTFLIVIRITDNDSMNILLTSIKFIQKYIKTNIFILEADKTNKLTHDFGDGIRFMFVKDDHEHLLSQKYINYMAKKADTPIIIRHEFDRVITPNQLYDAVLLLRSGKSMFSIPHCGYPIKIKGSLREEFANSLNSDLLFEFTSYENRNTYSCERSFVAIRDAFISIGMTNYGLKNSSLESKELYKRIRIFGFTCLNVSGPIFQLINKNKKPEETVYIEEERQIYEEFVKVCNSSKKQLSEYISTWDQ